jgi:hypothetical protein
MVVGSIGSILNIFHGCTLWLAKHAYTPIWNNFSLVSKCQSMHFFLAKHELLIQGRRMICFFGILKRHKRDKFEGKVGLKIMKKKRDKVAEYVKTLKQSRIDALYF